MGESKYTVIGVNPPSPEPERIDQHEQQTTNQTSRLPQGWRRTVLAGAVAIMLVLVVNVAFLAWTVARFPVQGGAATIYTGSCAKVKAITTWSHLGINVLGTVLLAASNSCMQVLVAPTRAEVDAAHRQRRWLDIGTQTLRNLKTIKRKRVALWTIVGLSSMPLHLLYNSVIVGSTTVNRYNVYTVTTQFFNGTIWNESQLGAGWLSEVYDCLDDARSRLVVDIQRDANSTQYVRLQPEECLKTYAKVQNGYGNLLLVTNESSDGSLVRLMHERGGIGRESYAWVCQDLDWMKPNNCNLDSQLTDIKANGWWTPGYYNPKTAKLDPNSSKTSCSFRGGDAAKEDHMFLIDYCLAQPTTNACSVFVAVPLLAVVVASNALKLICLLITFWCLQGNSLLTIGDAMDSFLREVDGTTADFGPLDAMAIGNWTQHHNQRGAGSSTVLPWIRESASGMSAISPRRWFVYNLGFITTLSIASGLLVMSLKSIKETGYDASLKQIFDFGLGKIIPGADTKIRGHSSLATSILAFAVIANIPQLIISILYMAYNDAFTRMAMAREWASFYRQDGRKQPLRVSRPQGLQRSTSFLQMPVWWSVPIMAMMTCLHWAVSQSIFLAIEYVADYGKHLPILAEDTKVENQTVTYSPLGIIVSITVGIIMVLVLWLTAGLIRLTADMPIVWNYSAAISAACHRPSWDDDAAVKMVSWCVWAEEGGVERVGFSSGETRPLQGGVVYSNRRNSRAS